MTLAFDVGRGVTNILTIAGLISVTFVQPAIARTMSVRSRLWGFYSPLPKKLQLCLRAGKRLLKVSSPWLGLPRRRDPECRDSMSRYFQTSNKVTGFERARWP